MHQIEMQPRGLGRVRERNDREKHERIPQVLAEGPGPKGYGGLGGEEPGAGEKHWRPGGVGRVVRAEFRLQEALLDLRREMGGPP